MGMFERLKTVISSHINALITKAEDPEKMLNQSIIDMNSQMVEAKTAVAKAIADEKRLEREAAENKAQSEDWERKAVLAVKAQRDDLAKEALLRKQEYDGYVSQLLPQIESQKAAIEKLKEKLKELQSKIDEASRKKNILIARARRAEAQEKINQTMSSIDGNTGAFDTFDRMSQKVDELEAKADANQELQDFSSGASLDKQFAELEKGGASADIMLEELKRKMLTDQSGSGKDGSGPSNSGTAQS